MCFGVPTTLQGFFPHVSIIQQEPQHMQAAAYCSPATSPVSCLFATFYLAWPSTTTTIRQSEKTPAGPADQRPLYSILTSVMTLVEAVESSCIALSLGSGFSVHSCAGPPSTGESNLLS